MARLLMIESWLGSTGTDTARLIVELGHEYVLVTRDPELYRRASAGGGPHSVLALASGVVTADTNDVSRLLGVVGAIHRAHPFDGVLTSCDYYLEAASRVAAHLGLPGTPPEAMRTARDKHLVREALQRAGLPNPPFALITDLAQQDADAAAGAIGYPLVAKPVDLHSGALVRRVSAPGELRSLARDIRGHRRNSRDQPLRRAVLLEEFLTGAEVSVETVTCFGATTVLGITDKSVTGAPAFVESGHMFPARLDDGLVAEVTALVRAALEVIGYSHGLAHTEVKLTPDGPRIVEVNTRYGGNHISELMLLVHGTDVLVTLVQLALGQPPTLGDGATGIDSAAVAFLMSPRDAVLDAAIGAEGLERDPHVARVAVQVGAGEQVHRPRDNGDYLGHVLTLDRHGLRAREYAEQAVAAIQLRYHDGQRLAPVPVALHPAA